MSNNAAGKALAELLKLKDLSQRAAADLLGIKQPSLHAMIHGDLRITADMAVKIERNIGGRAETFVYPQAAEELAKAREAA
ncbi:helix-turn-helix domain-containing protein [Caballeronia sp. AZ10_KS36]|uniref:helix-turn-helix transcriptional regulator n=1 Tax=Caballeronia sp. AZ10_KS36 TaxID=2921757 RepID=UPI0020283514|nr:helix-turn-helix domain-containing protein [Caballeronia sp. AZ10_KS36]